MTNVIELDDDETENNALSRYIDDWQAEINEGNYKFHDSKFFTIDDEIRFIFMVLNKNGLSKFCLLFKDVNKRFGVPQIIQFCVALYFFRTMNLDRNGIDHLTTANIPIANLLLFDYLINNLAMCLMMKFSCFHDIIESCNNNYQHFEFFAYLLLKLTIPIWLSIYGALPPFDERRTFLLNHKTTFENQLSTLNETHNE